jgi:hypothetical protein
MDLTDTPAAIRAFIDAMNAGDSDAFAAAFTPDATLDDWGRGYAGHAGVRDWDHTDNIGMSGNIKPIHRLLGRRLLFGGLALGAAATIAACSSSPSSNVPVRQAAHRRARHRRFPSRSAPRTSRVSAPSWSMDRGAPCTC